MTHTRTPGLVALGAAFLLITACGSEPEQETTIDLSVTLRLHQPEPNFRNPGAECSGTYILPGGAGVGPFTEGEDWTVYNGQGDLLGRSQITGGTVESAGICVIELKTSVPAATSYQLGFGNIEQDITASEARNGVTYDINDLTGGYRD